MEKWWKLTDVGSKKPWAVMFLGEDNLVRRYVPGEGLVHWPSLMSYLFGEDMGAIPITRAEALELIKAQVGKIAAQYVTQGRGQGQTLPVPG